MSQELHNVIDYDTVINIGTAHSQVPLIETMCMSAQVLDFDEVREERVITIWDLHSEQHEDHNSGPAIQAVSQGKFLKLNQYISGTAIHHLVRELNNSNFCRGLLIYSIVIPFMTSSESYKQFYQHCIKTWYVTVYMIKQVIRGIQNFISDTR